MKKQIKKWSKELRSGKYRQANGHLNTKSGFCCLGVACKTFIDKKDLLYYEDIKLIEGSDMSDQPNAPYWLSMIENNFFEKTGAYLAELNDAGYTQYPTANLEHVALDPFTFNEIADLLEMVYVLEVL